MEWRKRWAKNWHQVRYCSQRCRRRGLNDLDRRLESELEAMLTERGRHKTLCPSEVARRVGGEDWRPLMEPTRMAARRLAAAGRLEILQKGRRVDPSTARGAIRLRGLG